MAKKNPDMVLHSIGVVRNELKKLGRRNCEDIVSEIVVDNSLTEALDDLEEFSHIIVLYWMNQLTAGSVPNKITALFSFII